ncbi:MAG: MFS transporter [Burkholderiaceae bacterium]|nr:MFS transporter [Burkholderiaceae bacterium]
MKRAGGGPLFRDGDFRRLWAAGLILSLVRWLEILVFGVFVYQQTGSAFLVASMTMLRLLPLALFGVVFGSVAARIRRRTGLIVMLAVLIATGAALLSVAALGQLAVWHLAVASFVSGTAWAADNPVRRGLIGDVAGVARMGSAMAFDVGASNASRLAGPGLGGLLLASHGMASVLVLVTVLHLVALVAALRVSDRGAPQEAGKLALRATLASGFRAARDSPRLAGTLWITMVFNLFGWPVLSMIPVIGQDRLGLEADGIGLLASMDGVGSLLGALALAAISRPAIYGRLYIGGVTLFLALLPVFALSTQALATAAALLVVGIGQAGFSVMQATIVYVAAPVERRTQAMGLLTMCIGVGPIGFLMLGWLAEWLGASAASVISAVVGLLTLAVSWSWWRACWRDGADGAS